jgi:hypothetical protein
MSITQELAAWYHQQCDGDWEHIYGITIETLDNPGWRVKIDLVDTELADQPFQIVERLEPELTWLRCWVADQTFHAAGGPEQLEEMLSIFLDWAKTISK